ncbi:MAG: hypothetical protein BA863_06605 [Desulfovibrio sp. S3730MH75]|nr:MAG: hypothetical protein BA863_06605 [Desulfovibrio sp. S3730MH75]
MPKIKVTLDIGFPTAMHEDIIEIDETEWSECETEGQREALAGEYWQDWANNHIDGHWEIVE